MNHGLLSGWLPTPGNFRGWLACLAGVLLAGSSVNAAPTITTPPAGAIICAGTNVVLTVSAAGTGALSYQWQLNRTNLAGATSATLVLNNIQPIEQGHYRVTVTDSTGSVTSDEALVVVLFPPTVVGQTGSRGVDSGQAVSFTVLVTAKPPSTYQWRRNGANIAGATNNTYAIASVNSTHAGTYDCLLSNPCGTATSAGAVLSVDSPPLIVSDPQDQTVDPGTDVTFSAVASGSAPLSYQWCKDGATIIGATSSSLLLPNVQFADEAGYSLKVTNPFGSVTSRVARLTVSGRPFITLHPIDQAVLLGDSATFAVAAIGRQPLSYQWMKEGVDIPGATSTQLTISNIVTSDLANYSARAFNAEGTAVSSNATLTVSARVVQVSNIEITNFTAGTRVAVPVRVVSEGGENRVTMSLSFDPGTVTFQSISNRVTGATATGALANAGGILTADWQLPSGQSLTAGTTNTIFDVVFTVNTVANQRIVFLPIEDAPVNRRIFGTAGQILAARYVAGSIVFQLPRPIAVQRGFIGVNPATGFTEEFLELIMPALAAVPFPFPELSIRNLHNDSLGIPIGVSNATKTGDDGFPSLIHPGELAPGSTIRFTIEYSISDRITVPETDFVLRERPGTLPEAPEGGQEITFTKFFYIDDNGRANNVVDFPSTAGRTYRFQYRDSTAAPWKDSFPPQEATGISSRWPDFGSPRTDSAPTANRLYRVLGF